jgi:hypothetical protein
MSPATATRHGGEQRRRLGWLLVAALAGAAFLLVQIALGQHSTVAQAAGTKEISAKALNDHECDDTEWHFVINQLDSDVDAPATIHVTWANGNSADVPLDKVTGGVAHYRTTANLDSTVTSATAVIYDGWSGQFNLSHGPCGPTTPPSSPTPPPSTSTAPSTPASTPPSSASSTPSTSTAPPTHSTSTPPPSASTTARTTTPASSSSAPAAATSGTTSLAAASTTTSPFVPGPGETGDMLPRDGFPLGQILSGLAAAMLAAVGAMAVQVLRRRGNHS